MNAMWSTLHLVYPPVSSYEADSLREDPQVEALIRSSDFYMIAMRPEVQFDDIAVDADEALVSLRVTSQTPSGEPLEDDVTLDIAQLAENTIGELPETYILDGGRNTSASSRDPRPKLRPTIPTPSSGS